MFGLDNPSGINVMPDITPVNNPVPLWFTEGGAGLSASYPGQEWFNQVQAELLNVLKEAGVTPDKGKLNQLSAAIKKIVSDGWLSKQANGADIPNKTAFMSNVGAYPKTGGKISGEVTCQRLALEADIPYLAGFDTQGTRQFFCGCASDGPLYFKNDTTEATLKITDVFYFNNQVIPADYANFDQRYQIYGEIRLFPFRPNELPPGWHHCNGDKHHIQSTIGRALAKISSSYRSDFRIINSGDHINLPNFYSSGRGLFLRPSTSPGQIVPDSFRAHSHPDVVSSIDSGRIVNYGENAAVAWFSSIAGRYPGRSRPEGMTGGAETAPMHIGMTPALFLGV
ncbi:hypothetical protein XNC1_3399 [Xenorhabdus nematophila ATCC 19061]|uniref:Tail fiber protein n=1 Tax=Xenorhabdus nematophila (strain ATCC 19061 / DSM 3370 / CCUG 14189 / LMG 1036 / NCIMB 9965 / AN6) TaxID=406817 RepID=D3V997_XENNA|nr:hypothetical protein [Xenorhabdus nematophila]CBJ91447.1 hypothetical protein XNC1_3399 [Xenorhabdus nematophila ATCC 19061]CEK24268.1 hypothetical protein XNC2_3274 [Xenorhabdus nematophila AN6/1]